MKERGSSRNLPDVRDGLTRVERVVLLTLVEAQRELGRESVPLVLLYGRVLERIDVSEAELRAALARLGASVNQRRRVP
jgi:hypothetical protein